MGMALDKSALMRFQVSQQDHDIANHFEIICLHKADRLKHYGLHFSKYVGRLARNRECDAELKRTLVDIFLISLSAANALNHRIYSAEFKNTFTRNSTDIWEFADAVGKFADACEKIDHLESFRELAVEANVDIMHWVIRKSSETEFDIESATIARRIFLAQRLAYHAV